MGLTYDPRMTADTRDPVPNVRLRLVRPDDIPVLYQHQLDNDANRMAAVHPRDESAFRALWDGVFKQPSIVARAIIADDELVGHITIFNMDGVDGVGYWIAKTHWGRGIATRALTLLLEDVNRRPLHARVAVDNKASIRVLERCGFVVTGYQHSPGTERYVECEEAVLVLE